MKATLDLEKLRVALRRMSRGHLLRVAERAIEILPKTKLRALVGNLVRLEDLAAGKGHGARPLLEDVRTFHDATMGGAYHQSFDVNSKNFMKRSAGTEAFLAEFDRLLSTCVQAASKAPHAPAREAFDLLFALLRQLDRDPPTASSSSPTRPVPGRSASTGAPCSRRTSGAWPRTHLGTCSRARSIGRSRTSRTRIARATLPPRGASPTPSRRPRGDAYLRGSNGDDA